MESDESYLLSEINPNDFIGHFSIIILRSVKTLLSLKSTLRDFLAFLIFTLSFSKSVSKTRGANDFWENCVTIEAWT